MTYIIAEPCIDIKDKSCVDVCPVDCIHETGRQLVIDPDECIDCGVCEPECPVEAIFPEDALPEKWEPFIKINYAYRDGADAAAALVSSKARNTPLHRVIRLCFQAVAKLAGLGLRRGAWRESPESLRLRLPNKGVALDQKRAAALAPWSAPVGR